MSTARISSRVLLGSVELPNLIPFGPMDSLHRSDYCFCHRRDHQGSVNTAVRLVVDVRSFYVIFFPSFCDFVNLYFKDRVRSGEVVAQQFFAIRSDPKSS